MFGGKKIKVKLVRISHLCPIDWIKINSVHLYKYLLLMYIWYSVLFG